MNRRSRRCREQADLIGPLQVVDRDEQRPDRCGRLQPGGDPVSKDQRLGDDAVICSYSAAPTSGQARCVGTR